MDSSSSSPSLSSDQIQRLKEKVNSVNIPSDLKQSLAERIDHIATLRSSNAGSNYILAYESTTTYINWIVGLPWNTLSTDTLDLAKAQAILDANHFGLAPIKNRILEYLAALMLNLKNNTRQNSLHAPILCLVGLAGTGKTTLAASIAQSLGRNFERIPFGGMGSARSLRGESRTFPDAEPGLVIKKLVHAKTKNCVILLDEIDRVSEIGRADIMGVLVELLDPEQNITYTDHYIDYPFNLSNVLFVATSNNTTNISTAVLDRLEILQMPSYSDEEKIAIGKKYLFPKIRTQTGLAENQIIADESVWNSVIRPLGFDPGIRSLERTIEGMCRKVARLVVEGKAQSIEITSQNMREYLPM